MLGASGVMEGVVRGSVFWLPARIAPVPIAKMNSVGLEPVTIMNTPKKRIYNENSENYPNLTRGRNRLVAKEHDAIKVYSSWKLDELFLAWLSLSETQEFVLRMMNLYSNFGIKSSYNDAVNKETIHPITNYTHLNDNLRILHPSSGSPRKIEPARGIPKKFFFPKGDPDTLHLRELEFNRISNAFDALEMEFNPFVDMMKEVCGFAVYIIAVLFDKLETREKVCKKKLLNFWRAHMMDACDAARYYYILKSSDTTSYLTHQDIEALVKEIVVLHPGLEFLEEKPEFQQLYVETVVARIFYGISRSKQGIISLSQWKHSNIVEVLHQLESDEDEQCYFSYKHFYVIYCKFWEVDTDHDLLIDQEDLLQYSNSALTTRIVEAIFEQPKFAGNNLPANTISYQDFVWFILSEEDKTTPTSLEFWFNCTDIDCDGVLSAFELQYFFEEQQTRLLEMEVEPISFGDLYCQILDMVKPKNSAGISLMEIKKCNQGGQIFNLLFNLNKFIQYEKDPFMIDEMNDSDWNSFASLQYKQIAAE